MKVSSILSFGAVCLFGIVSGVEEGHVSEFVGMEIVQNRFPLEILHPLYHLKEMPNEEVISTGQTIIGQPDKKFPAIVSLPNSKRKRVLVTGGAGFVGSHLVDRLMLQGHEVTVLDNFFTGRKINVEHWIGHPNFELVRHDVIDPYMMEVDEIYSLACPASPPHYQYNPVKTIKTSVMGTINMLGLAKRTGAKMLVASTSEVYGDPEVHPQKEEYWGNVNTMGPRSCYDEGKRVAETLMYSYHGQNDVDIRVVRIFNTFGPRMHENDGRVVSNFILQALRGDDITIYGDGSNTRSFQYVHDLVDGLMALMASDCTTPVNIGNPDEYTIGQFAELIKELTGSKSKIIYMDATEDDPKKRKPDITKAKEVLNWEPKFHVRQGLEETIKYFSDRLTMLEDGDYRRQAP
jgi:UDP-glucuronate decarboxylase